MAQGLGLHACAQTGRRACVLLMPCTTSTSKPRCRSCASEKSALASSPGSVMRYALQGTCGCLLHSRARWQKLSHACAGRARSTEQASQQRQRTFNSSFLQARQRLHFISGSHYRAPAHVTSSTAYVAEARLQQRRPHGHELAAGAPPHRRAAPRGGCVHVRLRTSRHKDRCQQQGKRHSPPQRHCCHGSRWGAAAPRSALCCIAAMLCFTLALRPQGPCACVLAQRLLT